MNFVDRIRNRKLAQWGLAYLAGAWVLLQVLDFVSGSFGWSPRVARVATVLAAAGFLAVLVLAWYHGERGRQKPGVAELAILGVITIAGGGAAWMLRGDAPQPLPVVAASEPIEQNSIAVLSFVDMSAGKDQEYFSDGISEEILNALARTPGLRVAARTSSFLFKGKQVKVEEVGRQLRVANVLEGSVRRFQDRVRIAAQLIDARNGFQIWSATYDRDLCRATGDQPGDCGCIARAIRVV
jgi:TolB-like protein